MNHDFWVKLFTHTLLLKENLCVELKRSWRKSEKQPRRESWRSVLKLSVMWGLTLLMVYAKLLYFISVHRNMNSHSIASSRLVLTITASFSSVKSALKDETKAAAALNDRIVPQHHSPHLRVSCSSNALNKWQNTWRYILIGLSE